MRRVHGAFVARRPLRYLRSERVVADALVENTFRVIAGERDENFGNPRDRFQRRTHQLPFSILRHAAYVEDRELAGAEIRAERIPVEESDPESGNHRFAYC